MNAAIPRQKFSQQRNSEILPTAWPTLEIGSFKFALLIILLVSVLTVVSGCASRRPLAASQPPEPSTPETVSESAKNSTSPVSPRPGSAAKRRRDASIPVPAGYEETGEASWYGVPFHGRQASNGEIYDMNKLTAAHRTLPFETMVRVTNERNGKSTVVRITDRGPFVNNRIIDLSYAAAREIDSIGPGVVPVRLEVLSTGINPEAGFFTIQVGSFRERANAERLRERLSAAYSPTFVKRYDTSGGSFYRVHVGKVSGEEAAKEFGERLRTREGVTPMVIRLDDTFSEAGENQ
ncbi:MAG TPA: septal ring lytic transglycosylase RlpA family protein [Methylomirabilota bacterium]|nr:septal ring lytic transglycosylase RlpA family protein [Methylomirabilota bacterium]